MKNLYLIVIVSLIIFTSTLFSQTITYNFEKPQLKKTNKEYTEIIYRNCRNYGEIGKPSLPYLGKNILLPQNQEIENIKIVSTSYYKTENNIIITPASKPRPLSYKTSNNKLILNSKIYNSSKAYPDNIVMNFSTHFLCGHSIGSFSLCPVIYFPAKNQVRFIKKITLEIKTKTTKRALSSKIFLRKSFNIKKRIDNIVDNPEMLKTYTYPENKYGDESDILLITNNELLPAFHNYIEFKQSTGFIVSTKLTEDIYNEYTGVDKQEKIRNCIIDFYQNHGISYVILGGDADHNESDNIVPDRGFYVNTGFGTIDEDIPSDMYYSNLDGTWNDDGDDKWGEPGEEDLYAELSIGRICADDTTEVNNQTNKLQMYQDSPVINDIEKALMLGEYLWTNTYGGQYKNEVADGSSNHGYTTVGISDNFSISKLYEMNYNWKMGDVFNQFNNTGINLLNHLGHSNTTYNMKMSVSCLNTRNFKNDGINRGFSIGYSQGCYNGSFDNRNDGGAYGTSDCFAEDITTIPTAEVASIGNSRYGWGSQGSTNGASQYFDRQFFDAIFGENITKIGEANGDSKEDNAAYIQTEPVMRWCAYEINLFGDPSMDIWTAVPTEIIATYYPSLVMGANQFSIQTNTPFARIALLQNGELIGRKLADNNGNANISLFSPVNSKNSITVSIIGHNKTRYLGNIIVVENEPYIVFDSYQIDDSEGNGNGLLDYGETVNLSLSTINIGTQPTSDVFITLSTQDTSISFIDSIENYGYFAAGDTITIENAFSFKVSPNVPAHAVTFNLKAVGDSTWNSSFTIYAHAPDLEFGTFDISDVSGNNNGIIDPGETVGITISINNSGSSKAFDVYGNLTTENEYITIDNDSLSYGDILSGGISQKTFNITASSDIPDGSIANFDFNISAFNRLTSKKSFYTFIGQAPILILDLDGNKNSGSVIQSTISELGVGSDYITEFPDDFSKYSSIFVCLGVLLDDYHLSSIQDQSLANFLDNGKTIYMEGGNTWDYKTELKLKFNINYNSGALNNLENIQGQDETFTQGMNFNYTGDNNYIDQIEPKQPAFSILKSNSLGCAVAYDAGNYKTIGSSFEFGGLNDNTDPSTKVNLMKQYLEFFGLISPSVSIHENKELPEMSKLINNYPNPFKNETTINFEILKDSKVKIEIYNIQGKKVISLINKNMTAGYHKVTWDGKNNKGKTLDCGVYFCKLYSGKYTNTKKIILIK